jgi:hypothetical protein
LKSVGGTGDNKWRRCKAEDEEDRSRLLMMGDDDRPFVSVETAMVFELISKLATVTGSDLANSSLRCL